MRFSSTNQHAGTRAPNKSAARKVGVAAWAIALTGIGLSVGALPASAAPDGSSSVTRVEVGPSSPTSGIETADWKFETESWKFETEDWKFETEAHQGVPVLSTT